MSTTAHLPSPRRICSAALSTLLFALAASAVWAQAPEVADPLADASRNVDHAAEIKARRADDVRLAATAQADGVVFEKLMLTSRSDTLQVPAYHFAPPEGAAVRGALVWVYGGIHDRFGTNYYPFIREAVGHGFKVIAPEYRGARGYGAAYHRAMDYGGGEVDDILAAADVASQELPPGQPIYAVGWSHGGLISLLAAARDPDRFAGVVASVPVVNLVTRMAYKGPEYHDLFASSPHIGGPVHEALDAYLRRSPQYQVHRLGSHPSVRVHLQVATNDDDVAFLEAEPFVHTLRAELRERADLHVFLNPPHGHYFNRQVDLATLTRKDTEAQVASWRAIWRFLGVDPSGSKKKASKKPG